MATPTHCQKLTKDDGCSEGMQYKVLVVYPKLKTYLLKRRKLLQIAPLNNIEKKIIVKSIVEGFLYRIHVKPGDIIEIGGQLITVEECLHPTVLSGMCCNCGAELSKESIAAAHELSTQGHVSMIHTIPDLKVSRQEAERLGTEDISNLLLNRKLVLLVDLDQTLIHTTNDNIPPKLEDVYHFQFFTNGPWYHTRLRPYTKQFLEHISGLFELHICTFGVREYAHSIAKFLDPSGKLFGSRILSRNECLDQMSKTANLSSLFPCGENLVCIIDDRSDVWNFASNVVQVLPYHFFKHTGDINAPPGLQKKECDEEKGFDFADIGSEMTEYENVESSSIEQQNISSSDESTSHNRTASGKNIRSRKTVSASGPSKRRKTDSQSSCGVMDGSDVSEDCQAPVFDTEGNTDAEMKQVVAEVSSVDVKIAKDNTEVTKMDVEAKEESTAIIETYVAQKKDIIEETDMYVESKKDNTKAIDKDTEGRKVSTDVTKMNVEEKQAGTEVKTADVAMGTDNVDPSTRTQVQKVETSQEGVVAVVDSDDYLLYLEDILVKLHARFYKQYDCQRNPLPDLKRIVPLMRAEVLLGVNIAFSSVIPNHVSLKNSKACHVAMSLGAKVTDAIMVKPKRVATTHLITANLHTEKSKYAMKLGINVVNPNWLWCCAERWERVEEQLFKVEDSIYERNPPLHCLVPRIPDIKPINITAAQQAPKILTDINPLLFLSDGDAKDMKDEVDTCMSDDSDLEDGETVSSSSNSDQSSNDGSRMNMKRKHEDEETSESNVDEDDDQLPSVIFGQGDVPSDLSEESDSDRPSDPELDEFAALLERKIMEKYP